MSIEKLNCTPAKPSCALRSLIQKSNEVVEAFNSETTATAKKFAACESASAALKEEEEGFVDLLPLAEKTESGFYQWNTLDLVAAEYYKTVWYKANAGDRFRITGYSSASGADTYNVYRAIDANGAVIARQGNQAGGSGIDMDITMPDGTVFVSFTFHVNEPYTVEKYNTSLHDRVKLELFDARTRCDGHQYKSVGDAIRATTGAAYNSFGKKVVWFGTSIPEGCYDASDEFTSYPKIIGERLGLTVYNESVGSSPVRGMRSSQITADNPYGFIAENYKSSALSLATSLAEKEWLISNWNSDVFTGGKYTEMTDALAEEIRNCSYERKLDKYLTPNTFPDAFVFDHGRNDMWSEEDWTNDGTNPVNTAKRHNFHQAMNFLIDRILRYRKDAKILIIGHYTNKPRYETDSALDFPDKVAQAQEVLASEWNLPLLKTWEHTGWGNKCIYTSGQAKSTIMWALPDGVHPHSDKTGAAVKKMADIMTPFIRDNV